ncbi:MAG: YhdP family protein [Pseudomonadota bacterium]
MPVDSPSLLPLLTDVVPVVPARPGWRRILRRVAGGLLGVAATVLGLALVAWLGLQWFILPHIDQWRAEIETRTSQAIGVPIRLGGIQVQSRGWAPTIELRDVVLMDAQGREALVLPRVLASLSPRSLVALEPRFRQLVIDDAHLEIERNAEGQFSVAGLPLRPVQTEGANEGLNWVFRQQEIAIRGGSVRWTDLQRQAPPLAFTDVQLVIRNGLRDHALRLDATPPPAWGERFSLRGRFTQSLLADSGDWQHWSGSLYTEWPRADVRELKRYGSLPFELEAGHGALRAWVDLKDGRPVSATADLALRSVVAQLGPKLTPLALTTLQGRVTAEREGPAHRLELLQFGFATEAGWNWPRGDVALAWQQAPGQPLRGGELKAQRLDLKLMAQVATHLPLPDTWRQAVAQAQPQGLVQGLSLSWEGALDAPTRYRAKGLVNGLAVQALAAAPAAPSEPPALGRPGLQNASIDFNVTEKGGRAQVKVQDGEFTWPGLFEEATVPLSQLSAQLQWRLEPVRGAALEAPGSSAHRLTVEVSQASVANEDLQADGVATWSQTRHSAAPPTTSPNPGTLDLSAQLHRGRPDRIARYLPQSLPVDTRRYLAGALQDGRLSNVDVRLKGDLREFPFRKPGSGEFRVAGRVDGLTLAYVPDRPAQGDEPAWTSPWPVLTRVAGEVVLERGGLQVRQGSGQYQGVQMSKVQVQIRELSPNAVLVLDGQGQGPLSDLLGYVKASPVGAWTAQVLERASGTGPAELKLSLNIPLLNAEATTVKGSLGLAGNELRLAPDQPSFQALKGRVDFTQRGFQLVDLSTQVLGGDSRVEGGWQLDSGLNLRAEGTVSADGLRRATEWPAVARLAGSLSGQTSYRLALGWAHGRPELNLTSNGIGLASELPAPMRKAADAPWNLRLQTLVSAPEGTASAAPATRDHLRVTVGPQVQALYARELGSGTAPARVLRGQVAVAAAGASASDSTALTTQVLSGKGSGVVADIALPTVDVDAWRAVATQWEPAPPAAGAAPPSPSNASADTSGYLPTTIALRADEVLIASRKLQKVVALVKHDDGAWRTQIDAEQLTGQIDYLPARSSSPTGQVVVRLARLSLPQSDAAQVDALLQQAKPLAPPPAAAAATAGTPAPTVADTVPALDIVIDDFELRGKKLGRLEVEASNGPAGAATEGAVREWRLSRLLMTTPEARLSASGQWAPTEPGGGPRRVTLNFKLDLSDSGAFVERLGMGRTIRGGKGVMSGQLSWLGSPLTLDHGLTTGQMNVAIESGQFLKAEPGAARLLSVLSLQSLPRRLVLDFRDVFQEGFAFDGITGDIQLAQGVASTNNLRMRGVQAVVLMEGHTNLQQETQDLRVVVVPEINAGTASLAYAVINPALGLGTFLAQLFLRKPLAQASTREFHVTGPWADPQVTRVERRVGATAEEAGPLATGTDDAPRR